MWAYKTTSPRMHADILGESSSGLVTTTLTRLVTKDIVILEQSNCSKLAHSTTQIRTNKFFSTQRNFLCFPKKPTTQTKKFFMHLFEKKQTIFYQEKNFSYFPRKPIFHTARKISYVFLKKILMLVRKNQIF